MERDVSVNGVRLHCVVEGEGPLVLLLHGFPETSHAWRKQIPELARRFRVVAPDLRGYGRSDKPSGVDAYRTPVLADDVAGLVRAFGVERAHIVGHDWGGAVAWAFAMLHPDAIDQLVVLNCPHPAVMARALRSNWRQIRRSWYIFAFQLPWLPERILARDGARAIKDALRRSVRRPGGDQLLLRAGAERTAQAADRRAARPEDYRAAVRARIPARKIAAPTLLIWGEDDSALGIELTRGMEALFVRPPRIEYLPETSHWVMEERPDVVNRLLNEFLRA